MRPILEASPPLENRAPVRSRSDGPASSLTAQSSHEASPRKLPGAGVNPQQAGSCTRSNRSRRVHCTAHRQRSHGRSRRQRRRCNRRIRRRSTGRRVRGPRYRLAHTKPDAPDHGELRRGESRRELREGRVARVDDARLQRTEAGSGRLAQAREEVHAGSGVTRAERRRQG